MRAVFNPLSGTSARPMLAALLASAAAATPAHAQTVDYPELERTFGEPVTTSVSGKPQRVSDVAASLLIITRDDIRRSPARDIPDLLKAYAGITVTRWTAGQPEVAVRGGVQVYNPRLLVLVNGRQVYLDHYGMTNWQALGVQLEEIQQIEVVKGPGSALFGFNAAAGVVNIITVNPLNSRSAAASVDVGDRDQLRASVTAALPLARNIGLRLSGGYERFDEYRDLRRQVPANLPTRDHVRKEAAGDLVVRLDPATEATIGFAASSNDRAEYAPTLQENPGYYDTRAASARITRDTSWGALSAQLYRNNLDARYIVGQPSGTLRFHTETTVAAGNALVRIGTADVARVGAEYRHNQIKADPGYPGTTGYDVLAGNLMWEHRFARATVTLAGRVDHLMLEQQGVIDRPVVYTKDQFDRSLTEWSANAALRYSLGSASSLRVALGRGVQAPSLLNFGFRFVPPVPSPLPVVAAGDPATQAARVSSAELGYTAELSPSVGMDLTGFYTRTSRAIAFPGISSPPSRTPPAVPFLLFAVGNVGSVESYGVELSLHGRAGPALRWQVNYTLVETDEAIRGNAGGTYRQPLAFAAQTPRHTINGQLSYEHGPLLASVQGRYTSGVAQLVDDGRAFVLRPVRDALALDGQVRVALTPHLAATVTGSNVSDAAGATGAAVRGERRVRAGLSVTL